MFPLTTQPWCMGPGHIQPIRRTPFILLAMWQGLLYSPLEWGWPSGPHGGAMEAGAPAGETMRSTSITAGITISPGTITTMPIVPSPEQGIRTGSITRSTGGMPRTEIRQQPRSMGSSARVRWGGRQHQMPGVMVVAQEVAEEARRAISVVGQAQAVAVRAR